MKDVINANDITRKVGINHNFNFIIGHPTETYKDAMDSIRLAKSLKCSFVAFNNHIPYPGTGAYASIENNEKARFLYSYKVYLNDLTHKRLLPVFERDYFNAEERKKALIKGFNLEEKTLACFRFGKYKGLFVYFLTRNKYVSKMSHWLFGVIVSTEVGSAFYNLIVKPPW
ncbi:MAG: hypothetical protein KAT65_07595 [Methanophagales archaeon]|nr:hypothetical protein [Methanophagales archaeon]